MKRLVWAPLQPSNEDHPMDDFYQGASFSPDSLCLLTSRCNRILLFNTCFSEGDNWKPAVEYKTGDSVRCYQWYPQMQSNNPASCCFLGVSRYVGYVIPRIFIMINLPFLLIILSIAMSRDQPVHLYDAYTGQIRATYRPYNSLDELDSPSTFSFINQGEHFVVGGFRKERELQIFDLARPGRDSLVTLKLGKTRKSTDGQKGLVSALPYSPYHNLIASGTCSPGSIYLYDARAQSTPSQEVVISGNCIVGHGKSHSRKRKHFVSDEEGVFSSAKVKWFQSRAVKGVTQLEFSDDGTSLYSLSRRSNAVIQWDLRKLSTSSHCPGLASFETDNSTNQRLEFTLHQNHLYVGGRDRCVRVYDCHQSSEEVAILNGDFDSAVNGVSVTSLGGKTILASSTGTRCFPSESDYDDDENDDIEVKSSSTMQAASSTVSMHELPTFTSAVKDDYDNDGDEV